MSVQNSFEFWAEKAHLRTARSILDSGGAYGYNSDRDLPHSAITYDVYNWKLEGPTVSAIHLLSRYTDPHSAIAQAVDDLVVWYGNTLVNEHWLSIMKGFGSWLHMALAHMQHIPLDLLANSNSGEEYDFPQPCRIINVDYDGDATDDDVYIMPTTEAMIEHTAHWERHEQKYGYTGEIATAEDVGEFPYAALIEIYHNANCRDGDVSFDVQAANTYNFETSLSRTLQFLMLDLNGWPIALIQLHNGCDVRGGYTRPYAAELMESDDFGYVVTSHVDYWCSEGDASYYSPYDLSKAQARTGWSFGWVFNDLDEETEEKLERLMQLERAFGLDDYAKYKEASEAWEKWIALQAKRAEHQYQREAGQQEFWKEHKYLAQRVLLSPDLRYMNDWYKTIEEARDNLHTIWKELMQEHIDNNPEKFADWKDGSLYGIDSSDIALRCPECGELTMRDWHAVYTG